MRIQYQNDTLTLFIPHGPKGRLRAIWSPESEQELEALWNLDEGVEEKIIASITKQIEEYMAMGIDYFD